MITIQFFLSQKGILKNIQINIIDNQINKIYTFTTPFKILENDWDKEKQRPNNIYLKKYKKLNTKLDKIKKELAEYVWRRKSQKKIIQPKAISKEITQICTNKNHDLPEGSLLLYTQKYIDSKKELICHSSYKRYKVFFHLLERFEGFLCKKLYAEKINSDFIVDFITFGKVEEYSENTIYRTIHFVKTILNFVEKKGIRTCVRELEIRREKQKKEVITLTDAEIVKIQKTEVPKHLQAAKDWLLISCYTGQRISDFMYFNTEKLQKIAGKICLSFVQKKTKKDILLPLHPSVIQVIDQNDKKFPKYIDDKYYNDQIKEIGKLSKLNDLIKAKKRFGFRSKIVQAKKWQFLTSHIGRRSFATNFYGKIPTPLLMEATGHSTEQMFLRYINPVNEDRILSLSNYFDRIYEERLMTN